jgi:membrane associated rhomboid family serine protease
MGDREYKKSLKPLLGAANNHLVLLFAINTMLFIIFNFLKIVFALSNSTAQLAEASFQDTILQWFVVSPQASQLLYKPWTLLSYMFSHYGFFSLAGNLLWLWAFGFILQDLAGNKKLIPIYLYGGFVGAIVFVLSASAIPFLHRDIAAMPNFIGASSAVMAIVVATTTLAPNYKLFANLNGGIPLWVLTLLYLLLDFSSIASSGGAFALAHLASAATGYLFIKQLHSGNDLSSWMHNFANWFNDLCNPEKKHKAPSDKIINFYKTQQPTFKKTPNITEKKLNEILDKISEVGYENLSEDDKDFLTRAGKSIN